LIKANGEDIEYEFYFNGQLLSQNQTLFEVIKQQSSQSRGPGKSSAGGLMSYYQTAETSTVHFCIKDKGEDLSMQRKDSILEFS